MVVVDVFFATTLSLLKMNSDSSAQMPATIIRLKTKKKKRKQQRSATATEIDPKSKKKNMQASLPEACHLELEAWIHPHSRLRVPDLPTPTTGGGEGCREEGVGELVEEGQRGEWPDLVARTGTVRSGGSAASSYLLTGSGARRNTAIITAAACAHKARDVLITTWSL